jgi:uncharacterized lipoprotein YddW (UPF0748 family)
MKNNNNNKFKTWLSNNAITLIIIYTGIIIGYAALKVQVIATATEVQAIQERVDTYPSEQYFELKFKTLEDNQNKMDETLKEVQASLNKHLQEK